VVFPLQRLSHAKGLGSWERAKARCDYATLGRWTRHFANIAIHPTGRILPHETQSNGSAFAGNARCLAEKPWGQKRAGAKLESETGRHLAGNL